MEMFDLAREKPISMAEAAEFLPRKAGGKKLSARTIARWIMHGHHGVFLEGGRLGDSFVTSVESLQRFAAACARVDAGKPVAAAPARSTKEARRSHTAAKSSLERAGWGKRASGRTTSAAK